MGSNENPVPHRRLRPSGNPDLPQEGMATTAGDPAGATMTGPQSRVLESQFPNQIEGAGHGRHTQPFFCVLVQPPMSGSTTCKAPPG